MRYIKFTSSLIYIVGLSFFISSFSSSANIPKDDDQRRRKIAQQLKIASKALRTDIQKFRKAAHEAKRLSIDFALDKHLEANIYIANLCKR